MTDSPSRSINDLQVMAFRLGITPEEMIRIAEATSWEAVERAVARRTYRRNDTVRHIASGKVYRVKSVMASEVQIELVGGFETRWVQPHVITLVAGAE